MRTSTKGVLEILSHEAIVTRRYKDSKGIWTWAVGHTASAGPPDPESITTDRPIEACIAQFRKDLRKFERRVEQAVKVPLEQHEFDALVSFDFNTGGILKAKITQRLNAGDRAGAAKAFMGWVRPPEIRDRRTKEMTLFRDGRYSNDGRVTVYPASNSGRVLWGKGRRVNALRLLSGGDIDSENMPAKKVKNLRSSMLRIDEHWFTSGNLKKLQRALYSKGYGSVGGVPDGTWGDLTLTACELFVRDKKLPPNTVIDAAFLSRVENSGPRKMPDSRKDITINELGERGSQTVGLGKKAIGAAGGVGAVVGGKAIESVANTVDQIADPIQEHQGTLEWLWTTFGTTLLWIAALAGVALSTAS